jgi:HD-like signal output (HDOD) protein
MNVSQNETRKLDSWLQQLESSRVPVFTETVREVSGVAARVETSAHDLARAIGHDAALTARLLKIANSPLFNLQNRSVDTISAAVVLIGFDAVRELAVSLSLIEQVLEGRSHVRVTRSMARAFHAAAQARSFAVARKDESPEEVFVAALLLHLGEMVFWSVAEAEAAAIDRMTRAGASLADAEQRVLGFRLEALTSRLVEDWQLGPLLERAVAEEADDPRVATVLLGHEVAMVVEQFGWESQEVRELIVRVAAELDIKFVEAQELVSANVREAAKIAGRFGVPSVEAYLLEEEAPVIDQQPIPTHGANPQVQLETLQEIGSYLDGEPDLDELVRLVLGGVHRGVGFDRVFFGLLTPDRSQLVVRHALGGDYRGAIAMPADGKPNLLQAVLRSGKALWVSDENRRAMAPLLSDDLGCWVSGTPCVMMPVTAGGQAVGLLYADNEPSGRPVDDAAFAGFRHFGQQISLGLGKIRPDNPGR